MTPSFSLPAIKLLGLALLLQACAGQREGPRAGAGADAVERRSPGERASSALRAECLRLPGSADSPEDAARRRNLLLHNLILAIDLRYVEYEMALVGRPARRSAGAQADLRIISRVIADSERADNAVRSSGPGQSARARREQLRRHMVDVLRMQIRTNRAARRANIERRLASSYEDWNPCLALQDAMAYEAAGTLDAALPALAELVAESARAGPTGGPRR